MKPNILCVNPYIHDVTAYDFWMKPLGLSWLAGYLEQNGYEITFIDCIDRHHPLLLKSQGLSKAKGHHNGTGPLPCTIIEKPKEYNIIKRHYRRYGIPIELFQEILDNIPQPQAILVTSMMSYWYRGVNETISILRKKFPHVPIALGGVYASLCTEHAQSHSEADIVFSGAGEVQTLKWLDGITGLSHLYPEYNMLSGEELPMPYHNYISPGSCGVISTSLGCPLACSYCASKKLQPVFKQRPIQNVLKEIYYLAYSKHIKNIAFYDDALLIQANEHLVPILQTVVDKSIPIKFHTVNGMHSRLITLELAKLMKKAGVETLRFSYERSPVFSPQNTPSFEDADLLNAVECFQQADADSTDGNSSKIEVYVKVWMPGQTLEEMVDGFMYAHSKGCYVHITEYSPVPSTKDFEKTMELYKLPKDEPLFHNNTTLPYFLGYSEEKEIQPLKCLVNTLNYARDRGLNLLSNSEISKLFANSIRKLLK